MLEDDEPEEEEPLPELESLPDELSAAVVELLVPGSPEVEELSATVVSLPMEVELVRDVVLVVGSDVSVSSEVEPLSLSTSSEGHAANSAVASTREIA